MKTILLFLLISGTFFNSYADSKIPATSILKTDGTLRIPKDIEGKVDFSGHRLDPDPCSGPVLSQSLLTPTWNSFTPEIANDINIIAVYGGEIYIGGHFDNAGGDPLADNLARWDGKK